MDIEKIENLGNNQICLGNDLIQQLNYFDQIPGVKKIQKKISAELNTLRNVSLKFEFFISVHIFISNFFKAINNKQLTRNNILCSNLAHFAYLVRILSGTDHCLAVDYPVKSFEHKKSSIRIDIVATNGREWIKVITRNPKALIDVVCGRTHYGTKSILDHARHYTENAKDNWQSFEATRVIESIYQCNHYILK